MDDSFVEQVFRRELMQALLDTAQRGDGTLTRDLLAAFAFAGRTWRLVDESRGIRNPKELEVTLSIIHDPRSKYPDKEISPGVWEYAYERGTSAGSNTKLRLAGTLGIPVIFFLKLETGVFIPVSLAHVVDDDRDRRVFTVALDDLAVLSDPAHPTDLQRRYAERVVQQRLHQPAFRGLVLRAYDRRCSVCLLKHPELLDAAHIIGDGEREGGALVSNGLALCKIHHAAYDRDLLGISPDKHVHINQRLLQETDGPMLKHGLQEMHGRAISEPARKPDRPDRDRLAARFDQFLVKA